MSRITGTVERDGSGMEFRGAVDAYGHSGAVILRVRGHDRYGSTVLWLRLPPEVAGELGLEIRDALRAIGRAL